MAERSRRPWPRSLVVYGGGYLVIWLVFFIFIWMVEARERGLGDELAAYGVMTTATVTQSMPSNHNTICFTYEVKGWHYSGCGSADLGKTASDLPVGSETQILYSSRNPGLSCVCTAGSLQANGYQAPLFGAFWLGTFLWFVFVVGRSTLLRRPPRTLPPSPSPAYDVSHPFLAADTSWIRPGLLRWLWSGGAVTYDVPLSSAEVTGRLCEAIRPEGLLDSIAAAGQLRGWIAGRRFRVTTHLFLLSNSFNSILDGQVDDAPGGSRLSGAFRLRGYALWFIVFWIAFASLFGLFVIVTVLVDPQDWHPSAPPWWFGLLLPAAGLGVLVIGRMIARIQERTILRRLDELLGMQGS